MNSPDNLPFDREATYRLYLEGLLTGNRLQCQACFEQWMAATPDLRTLYENLVRRSLYDLGEQWERGRVSVATEHLATAISESLLNLTYPRLFSQPRVGKSAVITCLANEYHQIGGKMVADLFELHGWRGFFLGANTPLPDVKALIAETQPDAVALSLATELALPQLIHAVTELSATFPEMPVLIGGQAFRWGGRQRLAHLPKAIFLADLGELEAWITTQEAHV
jgi:methanogenic corrinoid protein MtbC1